MNMQQVALDVLSFHASSKSEEVELLLVSNKRPEPEYFDHIANFDLIQN